jgi:protein-S-isoprenylcysteine O-methyltransferase Ste14
MGRPLKIDTRISKALIEYASHGALILLSVFIYLHTPYYIDLLPDQGKFILTVLVFGYFFFGPFYFIFRNYLFPNIYLKTENKSTIVLRYIFGSIPKVVKLFRTFPHDRNFLDLSLDEKTRVALLSVVVKFFYIPLMISFLIGNFSTFMNIWHNNSLYSIFSFDGFNNWGYSLIYNLIFVIDTGVFCIGYLFEAKWLKNEIRSVDPYISGWIFALICYPPFNSSMGTFLQGSSSTTFLTLSPLVAFAIKIVTLVLYGIYCWASVALFTKASNLTNRGIVSSGPYKFIRHPAYICKNLAWWLEEITRMTNFVNIAGLLIWNAIYIMRALTEERHLMRDPDYRVYVKKVKYRFIPYIF